VGLEIRRDRAAGVPTDLDGFWEREGDIPRDIGYVNALSHLSLAAVQLEDRARAERLYELLSPYAFHNTPNSMLFYEGSAAHALVRLAALLGRDARVEEHFETALAMNERLGARLQLACVGHEYARFLAERGGVARRDRGGSRGEARRLARHGLARGGGGELVNRC
jgi:hypothetical protein